MKFHHIGIATDDIAEQIEKLKTIFTIVDISEIVFDEKQNVFLCLLVTKDNFKIELISGSKVINLIKKQQYLYHTCYEVENMDESITAMLAVGAMIICEPVEAVLFNHRRVAFLASSMGIVELLEL